MTLSTVTPAAIKSELRQMVNTLQTAATYQEALHIWQQENGNLTEDEVSQVMGIAKPATDPFGEQVEDAAPVFDPFG